MKKKLFPLVLLLFLSPIVSSAQNLTPEQIQQKASALGYNIDTTQINQYEAAQKASATVSKTSSSQPATAVAPPAPAPPSSYVVPQFANRGSASSLPAFGYNVFTYSPTTFQPSLNVPTPTNYIIGPGDEIIISLWGETQLVQDLFVSKNGDIYIPNVGLVSVNGLTMSQLRERLFDRLSKVYSSLLSGTGGATRTHLNVSTGQLRSVKIYVLGEVAKPGGYTLPSLSSSFTALYYSGGPTINGTLRDVEVIRNGKTVAAIDLYDYLIKGDQSEDMRLNDGDIIFVPPVGKRIAIAGSVFRPAIYELRKNESLGDVLRFAGGLTFNAYYQTVHIDRVIPFNQRSEYLNNILNIDLNFRSVEVLDKSTYAMDDGDVVTVASVNNVPQNRVTITGDVRQPGVYEITSSDMTVRDLVMKADSLFPDAFLDKATLIRTLPSGKKEVIAFNLRKALEGSSADNIVLQNKDSIQVYNDGNFFPTRTVTISGEVKNPGTYPRLREMTLTDLMINAGGVTDLATTNNIEITSIDTVNSDVFAVKHVVNLPTDYWNVRREGDFRLHDYDHVLIKPDSAKILPQTVALTGELKFPGTYTILYRGEKLFNFIKRTGGFKNSAYTEGMYLVRKNPQLDIFRQVSVPDSLFLHTYDGAPIIDKRAFHAEFGNRIPIQWNDIVNDTASKYNLELHAGDILVVPKNPGTVTVAGDVGLPSTVPYKEGAGLSYYIRQAGGYTQTSASGEEVVLLPNGKKWERSGWFFIPDSKILAGSLIYVPSEIQTQPTEVWPIIRDVITVVSSTAVLILTIQRL